MADFNPDGTFESNKADNLESVSSDLENKSIIKQDGEGVGDGVQANPDPSIAEINSNLENSADGNISRGTVDHNLDTSPIDSVGAAGNFGVINQEGGSKLADASNDCVAYSTSKNGSIGKETENIARGIDDEANIADNTIPTNTTVTKEHKELKADTESQEKQDSVGIMGCTSSKEKKDEFEEMNLKDVSEDEKKQEALRKLKASKTNDDDNKDSDACYGFEDMGDDEYIIKRKEANKKYEYFWKDRDICSQWHKSYFEVDDEFYTCAEQYMMHQKAVLFGDWKIAKRILHSNHPRTMKSLGRKVRGFSADLWNYHCLDIVKRGNLAKFYQNEDLKEELYSTYPKILVEASPYDTVWGIGLVKDDPCAFDESTWEGKNLLGYIITEVRDELMCNDGIIDDKHKKMYLESLREGLSSSVDATNNTQQRTEVAAPTTANTDFNVQVFEKTAGEVDQNSCGNIDEQQAETVPANEERKKDEQEIPAMEGQIGAGENEAADIKPDSSENKNDVKKENDVKESLQEMNGCEGTKSPEVGAVKNAKPVTVQKVKEESSDDQGSRGTIDTAVGVGAIEQTRL